MKFRVKELKCETANVLLAKFDLQNTRKYKFYILRYTFLAKFVFFILLASGLIKASSTSNDLQKICADNSNMSFNGYETRKDSVNVPLATSLVFSDTRSYPINDKEQGFMQKKSDEYFSGGACFSNKDSGANTSKSGLQNTFSAKKHNEEKKCFQAGGSVNNSYQSAFINFFSSASKTTPSSADKAANSKHHHTFTQKNEKHNTYETGYTKSFAGQTSVIFANPQYTTTSTSGTGSVNLDGFSTKTPTLEQRETMATKTKTFERFDNLYTQSRSLNTPECSLPSPSNSFPFYDLQASDYLYSPLSSTGSYTNSWSSQDDRNSSSSAKNPTHAINSSYMSKDFQQNSSTNSQKSTNPHHSGFSTNSFAQNKKSSQVPYKPAHYDYTLFPCPKGNSGLQSDSNKSSSDRWGTNRGLSKLKDVNQLDLNNSDDIDSFISGV